ncbi:anti-phage-associated DUF499 domain-containing protein [Roseomonas mucosa]|uniref:anti-phage-associated DUF499 domain-containing protein n=1 Tax=Roseomonas mucosa TaxID=207340 RepID=UPI0028CCCF76|nr:anti-phage-associated DUF499 domain-containing protein [Roseomonas mucosa]MDT8292055.1 anti-phage-associated DUF499 domain-containing protein [Roseomonas mucosa]
MLTTVRAACKPFDSVLRSDPEPDIEDIAQVIEAAEKEAGAFFARNHVTGGMKQLFELGIARLDGRSDQAVFTLTQAMGGGKTHLMVSFGLIAKSAPLRQQVLDGAGLRVPNGFGAAKVVAISGRQPSERYIWGEIAHQLDKGPEFRKFWESGASAPGEADWMKLIGDEPTLIMLDELAPYLDYAQTKELGQGTLANVVTYALANLFSAAVKLPRCMVVVSNLSAAYQGASRSIAQTVANLSQEVRRSAKEITPVALNSNEIFDILRRRLFERLPGTDVVDRVAGEYAKAMDEAVRSRTVARTPEQYAEEVHRCYPFHPRLRDLVALFRNNEKFRQTRGLMRMVSRIVKDVYAEGRADSVGLIGVQHMDLNDSDMRNEVLPLSDLQEAVAKDIADGGNSHAETVDRQVGSDAGSQVANVVLCASLMRGVDAKAGLTKEQVIECLVAPGRAPDEFAGAFDALVKDAWYIHRGAGEVVYFAPQENITKRLQSEADKAPQPRIDEGIQRQLEEVFRARQGKVYAEILALPELGAIDLSGQRKLIAINPDTKTPPELAEKLFSGLVQKNNFLIVTGSPTYFLNLDGAMRRLYAATKVLKDLRADDPLRSEVEDRRNTAEFDFLTQVENAFNRVWYPGRKPDRSNGLIEAKLELRTAKGKDGRSSLDGETAVEAALVKAGKYNANPEASADAIIQRIAGNPETNQGGLLWPDGSGFNTIPWSDITTKAKEAARFEWFPPGGLDAVKRIAVTSGKWRDAENGKVRRGPFPVDKTRVSVTPEGRSPDGQVRLSVVALDAGQTPRIHFAEGTVVSTSDPEMTELSFPTSALRIAFLAVDPKGIHPTGEPEIWRNEITIQHTVSPSADGKRVELFARPSAATIRYTVNGTLAREGTLYEGPFLVTPAMATGGTVLVRAIAIDGDLEGEETFHIPVAVRSSRPRDDDGVDGGGGTDTPPTLRDFVDEAKPAMLALDIRQSSTEDFFSLVAALKAASAEAVVPQVTVGESTAALSMRLGGDLRLKGEGLSAVVEAVRASIGRPDATVTSAVKSVSFPTGRDLIAFVDTLKVDVGDPRTCVSQSGGGRA